VAPVKAVAPKPTPVSKSAPAVKIPVVPSVTNENKMTEKKEEVKKVVTNLRYSDADLAEFKTLIQGKLVDAREELINLQAQILNANENGTDDTGASFKMLEDGSETLAKEEAANLAARQKKFIEQLEAALLRIENKTYGICRVTGQLIPKERLRAVPGTTQSMEAKLKQYKD
jgi:DnaK suppressor protein